MKKSDLTALLQDNPYPGRGIVLGRSADGAFAIAAYFIMGRSENSRNRVFVPTEDGIRTQAHDPAKMTDPSLIIYHPVRMAGRGLIVTNGDQTDTVRDYILSGRTFVEALKSRTFEPDDPNFTPAFPACSARTAVSSFRFSKAPTGTLPAAAAVSITTTHPLPEKAASSIPTRVMAARCRPSRANRSGLPWRTRFSTHLPTVSGPP